MKENNQNTLTTGNRFLMDMPTAWFMILSLIIVGAGFLGKLPTSMVGGFALFMSLGYLIRFVYWKVPLIKNTLGLASIGLTCAIIKHFGLWPENIVETMTNFIQGDTDFLSWFIAALITGSILGMNRELLIKAGIRYFVPITGGLVFAYLLGGLVGQAFGMSFKDTIFYIAGPIMGGGTGAGAVPMSEMYSEAMGLATDVTFAKIYPSVTIGNWLAIFGAIFLNILGKKAPRLTGNGALMQGYSVDESKASYHYNMTMNDLGTGLMLTMTFFILGRILNGVCPIVHAYAWTIISVAVCKISGILPQRMEYSAVKWYDFAQGTFTVPLSAGIGIAMLNLQAMLDILSPGFVIIATAVVLGAIIGAGLIGMLVKFYFVESAVTAGLCMANAGGNGDVMVLSSCDRMNLMSFAQISSRIGGALVLVVQSVLLGILL